MSAPPITNRLLRRSGYLATEYPKTALFLHHTAGANSPVNTIAGWEADPRLVATAFVIGGRATNGLDLGFDGKIYRAFDERYWCYHLGVRDSDGRLDKVSIGIELCNFGFLRKSGGQYYTYVNTVIEDPKQVIELPRPFRQFTHYHRYTEAQIEAARQLLRWLAPRFGIDLKQGLQEWIKKESLALPRGLSLRQRQQWLRTNGFVGLDGRPLAVDGVDGPNTRHALAQVGTSAFEFNSAAFSGAPGLWTHTNVRPDKSDCYPDPLLKQMILSL
jgi:hypothetical protein